MADQWRNPQRSGEGDRGIDEEDAIRGIAEEGENESGENESGGNESGGNEDNDDLDDEADEEDVTA